jgi:predicted NBD/HSP70 family sugar kinase
MVRAARRRTDAVSDEASLVRAFRAGDRATREVVEAAGDRLGMGIAVLIGALNVNHVLLIGPATQLGDDWLAAVRRRAESSALSLLTSDTVIELGDAREYDVLIGASALLMTQELGLSLTR